LLSKKRLRLKKSRQNLCKIALEHARVHVLRIWRMRVTWKRCQKL
jgi:hypothetical protein